MVLAVTAFVIVVIVVAVKEQKKAETPAPITRAQFRQVKVGMPPREVRRLLGDPTDAITPQDATTGEPIAGARCWYYGTELSKGGGYEVCFTRSRVDYKLRLG